MLRWLRVGKDWWRGRGRTRQERFRAIFAENRWGDEESVSGAGSRLDETASLRDALTRWIDHYGWRSMQDVGCGDFNWFSQIEVPEGFRYVGLDLVPELIDENRAKFASSHPWARFAVHDIVDAPPPAADGEAPDIVLCRNVLYHLSLADAQRAIAHLLATEAAWLLTTNKDDVRRNRDIPSGSFEFQNLLLPPFSLPEPEERLADAFGESLCLWRCEEIESVVGSWY